MKTKTGILYCIHNNAWFKYKKLGRTTQPLNKRISNLQTSLLENCQIIYTTDLLLDTYFYEYLLKQLLKKYRFRNDREFFDVSNEEIIEIYNTFNYINSFLNTETKLYDYIINNYPNYLSKRKKNYLSDSTESSVQINKTKIFQFTTKRKIFIDTSNL